MPLSSLAFKSSIAARLSANWSSRIDIFFLLARILVSIALISLLKSTASSFFKPSISSSSSPTYLLQSTPRPAVYSSSFWTSAITPGILSSSAFISANLISASASSFSAVASCFLRSLTLDLLLLASAYAFFLFLTTLSNCFCSWANFNEMASLLLSRDWQNSNCWLSFSICPAKCSFTLSNSLMSPAFVVYSPVMVSKSSFLAVCKLVLAAVASSKSPLSWSINPSNPSMAD